MLRVPEEVKSAGAAPAEAPAAADSRAHEVLDTPTYADDLIENLPDGLVVADANRVVRLVNTRAEELLGTSRGQLVGQVVTQVLPLRDDGGNWWDIAQPWSPRSARTGHPERLLTLDGAGPVLVSMRYVRAAVGAPVREVVISVREAPSGARDHAAWADLLAVAAHELRGPLTSVRGFSSALLRQWDRFTDEQRREMVGTIETDAQRLGRLLLELMDVSRVGTSRLSLALQTVDLREVVDDHLRRMVASGVAAETFRWAESAADGGQPRWVLADPDRVDQIVANLLDNALIHGAPPVTLRTDTDEAGMVALSVADCGPGVDPARHEEVFMKYAHGPRTGSSGLGLFLVKGLVEAHGGTITVGPAGVGDGSDSGACFRFTLHAAR